MPQLALSAASFTAAAAPAVAATAAKVGFMATMKSVAVNLLMNAAITAAMSALQPQVGAAGRPGEWLLSPDGPIPFAAGRVGVAGSAIHIDTFGPDLMYKGFVTVLSGAGPIDGFETFRGDDEFVSFDASGKAISSQWKGEMWLKRSLGAQPDAALTSPAGLKHNATLPGWTGSSRLSGKACDMLILGENSKGSAYPTGEVKPLRVFRGLRVWDPRLDSTYPGGVGPCRLGDPSTWVYSANPGLWAIKWSLGLWEGPVGKGAPQLDRQVGGIGAKASGIEFETLVALANIADANGWTCAAYPTTDDDKSQVLDAFLQAAGAIYAQRAGKISCIQRAAPRTSIVTISVADTAGPLEIDTAASRIDRINTIRPRFWSEPHRWQLTALKEVTAEAYQTEDGGERPRGIDYPYVTNAKQAAQLAALQIAHTREGIAGVIPLKPHLQRIRPGDAFTITEPGFVLNGVKCLCLNTDYDPATGVVRVSFVSETDAKYPFAMGQSPVAPVPPVLTPVDPTYVSPPLPEDWIIVPRPPAPDGTQVPGFDLSGIVSNDTATAIIVEWGLPPDPPPPDPIPEAPEGERQPVWADWVNWTQAYQGPPNVTTIPITGLQSAETYYVAIKYQRGQNYSERQVYGPYVAPTLAGVPVIDTTPPGVPAGLTLSSTSTPDAAGNPYVRINATWTANTDEDLNGYEVEVTESGFTIVEGVATNSYGRTALTGRSYAIRVRAVDKAGNRSDWSPVQNVTGAGDTTPPAAPTALSVSVSLGSFFLEWTNPSASDLSKIEVWEHTSNASGSATRIATVNAQSGAKGSYARSGMASGAVRYFWLKAVDTSGNASVFSTGASGTIPNVPAGEIDTTPPGVPGGLSLSTALVTDAGTGLPRPRVVATWTAPGDADLAGFDVEVTEAGGNPVTRMVSTARDQWDGRPNVSYQVRVRAFDRVGNRSAWSSSQSITAPADAVAPAAPTALAAVASVGSIFLSGVAPLDSDTAKIEVWENTTNNSGTAVRIAVVNAMPGTAWAHPRTGLSANDTRWYWAKAVDTSGNASAFSTGISRTVPYVGNPDIAVGTLTGDRLMALSVEGSVFKTNTSLPGTIEVGSTGVTIETIRGQANDPATRINANTTKIDPGKITLWGSGSLTDLPDWRMGGDVTRIDGGKISANTIRANQVEVGLRGIECDLTFTANSPTTNQVSWTAGTIRYVGDAGTTVTVTVPAGSASQSTAAMAIWFDRSTDSIATGAISSPNANPNAIILAVYYGGSTVVTNYGRTIIDGAFIRTGTLETQHHASLSITTNLLAAGAVTGDKVTANTFDGSVFKTNTSLPGTITVGNTGVTIQTVQDQAANPAAGVNAGLTKIDPGQITISGATTLAGWRMGGDETRINGGSISANTVRANALDIGQRGIETRGIVFEANKPGANQLSWTAGQVIYINDAGASASVSVAAGSSSWGAGNLYVYWEKGAAALQTSTAYSVAAAADRIVLAVYAGGLDLNQTYGRTVIDGSGIKTNSVTALQMNVTDLSAISGNIGNITAGKIGNAAGTTFFDLTNARQQFAIGAYVSRKGALGSGVLEWYGPNSVALGSETRTNGKFALGDDGVVYYGAAPLTPGSGVIVPKIVSASAQTAALTFDNVLTDGIWDMSLYALSAPGWISGAPSGTWAVYEQNVGSAGTAGTLIASGSVRPNGDYEPTTFDFGGGASSAVKVAGNRQLRVIVSGISATSLIFWATYSSATGGGGGGGSGGGSTGPALSDTAPPAIASAGAVGTAATAARGDHTHAHGNQGGGFLHSAATTSSNGFMSSSDKTKLDGSTITGAANSLVMTTSDGGIVATGNFVTRGDNVYFGPSGSGHYINRTSTPSFFFSRACTAPSFTPTSDPDLKANVVAVSDDMAALISILSVGQIEYDRVQDDVHALGVNAKAARDANPLWVVGGEALDPDGPANDLDHAVLDEDGITLRRAMSVDPMAMISSLFAAVRQLANDTGYAETRLEQALNRIEALEAEVAALTAA